MTKTTTTQILPGTEVATFATAVRAALSDLPPDDLDELTEGLEADLTERAAEPGADELGDPIAYAEELRAAAGYPPRSARSHLGDALPDLRSLPQELRRRWEVLLRTRPLIASAVEFFVALRPVWWVLRGLAAHVLLASFVGFGGTNFWPLAVVLVVLSVQVGRGRMSGKTWVRWITRAVSAVVIVAAPFLLAWGATQVNLAMSGGDYYEPEVYYPQQLTFDGNPVFNVFAYDADGNPIDQVQLYDQNGNTLNLVGEENSSIDDATGGLAVPNGDVPGRAGWNVYPLGSVSYQSLDEFGNVGDATPVVPSPPFATVKPLSGHGQALPITDGAPVAAPVAAPSPAPSTAP
ncbi:hypothetical protein BH09ACT4_BH09ACT4_21160 [soil metagenome]